MLFSDTTGTCTNTEMRISLIVCNCYIITLFGTQLVGYRYLARCKQKPCRATEVTRPSDRQSHLNHEMHVSLSARHHHIHPNTHGLRRRRHHVVNSIVGLHTEGQRRVGALWPFQKSKARGRKRESKGDG